MIKKLIINKKSYVTLALLTLLSVQFVGCTKNNTNEHKDSVNKTNIEQNLTEYGELAYSYLEHLQNNLPKRISGSKNEKLTGDFIINELKNMGYSGSDIQIQKFKNNEDKDSINIIVTKKGAKNKQIIVGAHYDSVDTYGVDDNGSGVSVALETAKRISTEELPYSVKIAFWGSEEVGLVGSKHYAESMSQEEKDNTEFVINIDSVLAGDKQYAYGGSVDKKTGEIKGTKPLEVVLEIAKNIGVDMNTNPGKQDQYPAPTTGDWSDHEPFRQIGIPYVYFEATNWDIPPYFGSIQTEKLGEIMHTKNDNLEIVNKEFPQRAKDRLHDYTKLVHEVLKYDGEFTK